MNLDLQPPLPRRDFLGTVVSAGSAAFLAQRAEAAQPERLFIEGYPNKESYAPGEVIYCHISTNADRYSLEIARVGSKREVVWAGTDLAGARQTVPAHASMFGCKWAPSCKLTIPKDWRSGYYSIILRGQKGKEQTAPTEMFFLVRSAQPGKNARILLQLATNTYQAYNNWGGSSLYSGPDRPRVSLDRPIQIFETPLRPGADWYNPNTNCCHTWDLPFLAWAEQAGYAIDCCANLDLELHPEILKHYRLVLSVGHDEYWSAGMRDQLEAFIANGGNVFFMSGNTLCWQVRVEDKGRALVCYKRAHERDPVFKTKDYRFLTTLWSDPLIKRPENLLTGVGFPYGGYNGLFGEFMKGPGAGEYTVHRPDHWLFAGTGLKRGDKFGADSGIAGYECDGCEFVGKDGLPVPTGRDGTPKNFQILATAPARWSKRDNSLQMARELRQKLPAGGPVPDNYLDRDGAAVLGLYQRGGTVVTVGSTDWSDGLKAGDRVVDRIVRNILDRLSK